MNAENLTVGVFLAGRWGSAFGRVAEGQGYNVQFYFRDPKDSIRFNRTHRNPKYFPEIEYGNNVNASSSSEETVSKSDVIVLALPARHIRSFYRSKILPFDKNESDILCLSKGLEPESNLMMSEVLEQEKRGISSRFAILSGPSFAQEVISRLPTFVAVASDNTLLEGNIQFLFNTDIFRIYQQHDLTGVQLGGAFKNVEAIAAGVCDGLGLGESARAGLITRSLEEIKRLGIALGGKERTFDGLSGCGDLWMSCTSILSRNHNFGVELARGKSVGELLDSGVVYEGYYTTKAMVELARAKGIPVPIAELVYEVLYEDLSIKGAIEKLKSRTVTSENGH